MANIYATTLDLANGKMILLILEQILLAIMFKTLLPEPV